MTQTIPEQDAGWRSRCNQRLAVTLEILASRHVPIPAADLQEAVAARVPLTAYDASTTANGGVRAWVNLRWNISLYQHAGWLHVANPGVRITRQGRAALAAHPDADDLFATAESLYKQWDTARKDQPLDRMTDPNGEIVHSGSGAAHALRAGQELLRAWREGNSGTYSGTPLGRGRLWCEGGGDPGAVAVEEAV